MTMKKSLAAMSLEKLLLKTSGKTFLTGLEFVYSAGMAPERITVMQITPNKFILQFFTRCDIRPFAASYPDFHRLLKGIINLKAWKLKIIEFNLISFKIADVDLLKEVIEKLEVELILLHCCTYPGIEEGDQAFRLFAALNNKKKTAVSEYGEESLKDLIKRSSA